MASWYISFIFPSKDWIENGLMIPWRSWFGGSWFGAVTEYSLGTSCPSCQHSGPGLLLIRLKLIDDTFSLKFENVRIISTQRWQAFPSETEETLERMSVIEKLGGFSTSQQCWSFEPWNFVNVHVGGQLIFIIIIRFNKKYSLWAYFVPSPMLDTVIWRSRNRPVFTELTIYEDRHYDLWLWHTRTLFLWLGDSVSVYLLYHNFSKMTFFFFFLFWDKA